MKRICDKCLNYYESQGQTREYCDATIIKDLSRDYANLRMNGERDKCIEFERLHRRVNLIQLLQAFGWLVIGVIQLILMLLAYVVVKPIYWAGKCLKWLVLAILSLSMWTIIIWAGVILGGVAAFLLANALYNIL